MQTDQDPEEWIAVFGTSNSPTIQPTRSSMVALVSRNQLNNLQTMFIDVSLRPVAMLGFQQLSAVGTVQPMNIAASISKILFRCRMSLFSASCALLWKARSCAYWIMRCGMYNLRLSTYRAVEPAAPTPLSSV